MLVTLFLQIPAEFWIGALVVLVLLIGGLQAREINDRSKGIYDVSTNEETPVVAAEFADDQVVLGNMEGPADYGEEGIWWHDMTPEQKKEYGILRTDDWNTEGWSK